MDESWLDVLYYPYFHLYYPYCFFSLFSPSLLPPCYLAPTYYSCFCCCSCLALRPYFC
jgi:hypothetical protein